MNLTPEQRSGMPASMDSVDGILLMVSAVVFSLPLIPLGLSAEAFGLILVPIWAAVLSLRRKLFGMPTVWMESRLANLAVAAGSIFGSLIAGFGAYTTWVNRAGTPERISQTVTVGLVGVALILFASIVDAWRRHKAKKMESETVLEFGEQTAEEAVSEDAAEEGVNVTR